MSLEKEIKLLLDEHVKKFKVVLNHYEKMCPFEDDKAFEEYYLNYKENAYRISLYGHGRMYAIFAASFDNDITNILGSQKFSVYMWYAYSHLMEPEKADNFLIEIEDLYEDYRSREEYYYKNKEYIAVYPTNPDSWNSLEYLYFMIGFAAQIHDLLDDL